MYKRQNDYNKGKILEREFIFALNKIGVYCEESSRDDDRLYGWDLKIIFASDNISNLNGKYLDVKGVKDNTGEFNWMELVGYSSKKQKLGWLLRGKADYLVFHLIDKSFIFVEKEKIREFVFSKLPLLNELYHASMVSDDYEYEMLKLINDNWNKFEIIETMENKFNALYDVLYSRPQYDHEPDLSFRLKTDDLISLAEYRLFR